MRLLAINNYDKDEYVCRWLEQTKQLDKAQWVVKVVVNGPGASEFPGVETIRCANPTVPMGFRCALAATQPGEEFEAIVTIHAKTWLPDLRLLDVLVERLHGHDAVMFKRGLIFTDAEFNFIHVLTPSAWRRLMAQMSKYPEDGFPELIMAWSFDDCQLDTVRITGEAELADGRAEIGLRIKNVADTGMDLYGCEPNKRTGFGHYLAPGGYQHVTIDTAGLVTYKNKTVSH